MDRKYVDVHTYMDSTICQFTHIWTESMLMYTYMNRKYVNVHTYMNSMYLNVHLYEQYVC